MTNTDTGGRLARPPLLLQLDSRVAWLERAALSGWVEEHLLIVPLVSECRREQTTTCLSVRLRMRSFGGLLPVFPCAALHTAGRTRYPSPTLMM